MQQRDRANDYNVDFALWSTEQAALLRNRQFDRLDVANVAEEIESLGTSDHLQLGSRLMVLLKHLLKWQHQPDRRSGSWASTIFEQHRRIRRLFAQSPSLKRRLEEYARDEYDAARRQAAAEMGVSVDELQADPASIVSVALEMLNDEAPPLPS